MRALAVILAVVIGVGCTRTVYVPKEVVRTEYRDRVRFDSIFERDSVFIREKGDTVFIYRDRLVYRNRFVRDTVCLIDSVSYPVVVEVEKQVRHIPKAYRWGFRFSLAAIAAAAVWIVRKIRRK